MHKHNIQWDCTLTLTVSTFFSENNIKLYSYYDHHVRNDFHIQIMFGSFSPPGGFISYLHYWRLFSHNDVLHCVVFVFVCLHLCCQFLWIINF